MTAQSAFSNINLGIAHLCFTAQYNFFTGVGDKQDTNLHCSFIPNDDKNFLSQIITSYKESILEECMYSINEYKKGWIELFLPTNKIKITNETNNFYKPDYTIGYVPYDSETFENFVFKRYTNRFCNSDIIQRKKATFILISALKNTLKNQNCAYNLPIIHCCAPFYIAYSVVNW